MWVDVCGSGLSRLMLEVTRAQHIAPGNLQGLGNLRLRFDLMAYRWSGTRHTYPVFPLARSSPCSGGNEGTS